MSEIAIDEIKFGSRKCRVQLSSGRSPKKKKSRRERANTVMERSFGNCHNRNRNTIQKLHLTPSAPFLAGIAYCCVTNSKD